MPAVFYFDVAEPECYLVAERILTVMPVACRWQPVLAGGLPAGPRFGAWRCALEREIALQRFELRAEQRGLQPVRWPAVLPLESDLVQRVATYAASIGRAVAFALAAFRQAYAAGRDLADRDSVLIAAAACEMHPAAVLAAAPLAATRAALERATATAAARGVTSLPAVWSERGTFYDDDGLDAAATALA